MAGGYRFLQIQCSNTEAVSLGFYSNRIKKFISQGVKKFLGENIKWAGTTGRGIKLPPVAFLALPLAENRVW